VAGDAVLQARPERARGGAGGLHGEGDDPVTGCHRRHRLRAGRERVGRLDLICRDLVSVRREGGSIGGDDEAPPGKEGNFAGPGRAGSLTTCLDEND
jgi:hypothetical protein